MNSRNSIELGFVVFVVSFVIYMDHGTFLGGIGDILAVFTVIYTWLNLVRNEHLEKIEMILKHIKREASAEK